MSSDQTRLGLRVDVDTWRGTMKGVPRLLEIFSRRRLQATFFFSVGPDNMGRNLWRLLRPEFLKKMWRSRAPSLYGWDILLRGTAWPGPLIGPAAKEIIRDAAERGHEIGLHAWDHFSWQHKLDRLSENRLRQEHQKAHGIIANLAGKPPAAAAAPGWRVNDTMLRLRDHFQYQYASDCRGQTIFLPQLAAGPLRTPQIPTTLPTFDELVGQPGVSPNNYNSLLLSLIQPGRLNIYTIHAEVEGLIYAGLFLQLLAGLEARGIQPLPLGALLPSDPKQLPRAAIRRGIVSGRAGWVSVQAETPE